jgi:4-amino-4-deoxy-L-arabinose transferase-like glycosyltransferase
MRGRWIAMGLALVLLIAAATYLTRLSFVPPYLMQDEVNFALQAHAIATTGRDTNGRLLPVYFSETGFEAGRDPIMIYWTALFLRVTPLSERSVRLPTALLAVLCVGGMFIVGRRLFDSAAAGLLAAAVLALTPGYFTNARLALSVIYATPIILAWLYCMGREVNGHRSGWAPAAGFCLGLGVYTYLASLIVMPALLAVTLVMFARRSHLRQAGWAVAGFAVALVPLAVWLVFHPDRFTNLVAAYQPGDVASITSTRDRLTAYWMFFNPDYLFLSGDGRLTNSTRYAGLFPIAGAILIPLGWYRLVKGEAGAIGWLVAAGFVLAPLATAASGRLEINRVLHVIPFGVLAAVAGIRFLSASRRPALRALAVVLAVGIAWQFTAFYANYMGPYRAQSAPWFGGNSGDALNAVLARLGDAEAPVYLNRRTPIERYWKFYAAARQRVDLSDLPTYYDPFTLDPDTIPPGAFLVCESDVHVGRTISGDPRWLRIASGTLPGGEVSHTAFERLR